MKHSRPCTRAAISMVSTMLLMLLAIPQAKAENSMLIQLNAQLNQENQRVKDGYHMLKHPSSSQEEANSWAKKAKALPHNSKRFAYAVAKYNHARAQYLQERLDGTTQIYKAAMAMSNTLQRMIDIEKETDNGNGSYFSTHDSVKTFQTKMNELRGVNHLYSMLINAGDINNIGPGYSVYKREIMNATAVSPDQRVTETGMLQRLKGVSEGVVFNAREYLKHLQQEGRLIGVVNVASEVNHLTQISSHVLSNVSSVFGNDSEEKTDHWLLTATTASEGSNGDTVQVDTGISKRLDSYAANWMSKRH